MPCYFRVEVTADDEISLRKSLKELGVPEEAYEVHKQGDGTVKAELKGDVQDRWGFNTSRFAVRVKQLSTFYRAEAVAKANGYLTKRKELEDGRIELVAKVY